MIAQLFTQSGEYAVPRTVELTSFYKSYPSVLIVVDKVFLKISGDKYQECTFYRTS